MSRDLSRSAARSLGPGEQHYLAYVGPPDQWDFMGATQFRLLTALGLRENHRVLDVGCGSLRAGRLMMVYLEKGHYFGIEPNTWLIEDAIEREVGQQMIDLKAPVFSDRSDFGADGFGIAFDFIVAQSIFSHCGPDLVAQALARFRAALAPGGLILATFILPDALPQAPIEAPGWTYPGCTTFAQDRIAALIARAGLLGRALPWYHPRQTWYVLAREHAELPAVELDRHLSGAVLRAPDFAASLVDL